MAHKIKISGTDYKEICVGKTMVDGTVREIERGKTCIDNTVYEIGHLDRVKVFITSAKGLSNNGDVDCATLTINGQMYNRESFENLKIHVGTNVVCSVSGSNMAMIFHNGVALSSNGVPLVTYEFLITTDTTFTIYSGGFMVSTYGLIRIYDEGHIMFATMYSEYVAREGMTWEEWIGSELYKNASFVIKDGLVYSSADATAPLKTSIYAGVDVKATDPIIANNTYH